MAFTRVVGAGIHTAANINSHNIKSTGIITATKFDGPFDTLNVTGDVDFLGNVSIGGTLTYEDVTNIDSVGLGTFRDGIDCNGDLDVDGHTNLDNVSIAGVTTFSEDVTFTTASGNNIVVDKSANKIIFGDNVLGAFGSDSDLLIHHTGSTGYIKNQTGNFYIQNDGVIIIGNQSSSSTGIKFQDGGAIELFFNNNNKLQTTNTGINVTGNTVADGLTIDGDSDLNGDLDVDGHTNLDNVSIAGVTTTSAGLNLGGDLVIPSSGHNLKISENVKNLQLAASGRLR